MPRLAVLGVEPSLEGGPGSVFVPGQVPVEPCTRLIQEGLLRPEVRRFLFYSSRGFQIAMAVVRALRAASLAPGSCCPGALAGSKSCS